MAYDDVKTSGGQAYSGMAVGRGHRWDYEGLWAERKLAPDRWAFTFEATKRRREAAPEGSGCAIGSQFHWLVVAHQYVRKVDANAYATFMSGHKYKVGHKRPAWPSWSYEYPGAVSAMEMSAAILMREAAYVGREMQAVSAV
jgi:hypothetical protein